MYSRVLQYVQISLFILLKKNAVQIYTIRAVWGTWFIIRECKIIRILIWIVR